MLGKAIGMIRIWKRTAIALVFAAGVLGGVALPASAASAAVAKETRVFEGGALGKDTSDGISLATTRARAEATTLANGAGFTSCPSERVTVFENPSPGIGTVIVTVFLTCVR